MYGDYLFTISLFIWFAQLFLFMAICGYDSAREHAEKTEKTPENVRTVTKYNKILWWMDVVMILSAATKLSIDINNSFPEYDTLFWVCVEVLILVLFIAKIIVKLFHLESVVHKWFQKFSEKFGFSDR